MAAPFFDFFGDEKAEEIFLSFFDHRNFVFS